MWNCCVCGGLFVVVLCYFVSCLFCEFVYVLHLRLCLIFLLLFFILLFLWGFPSNNIICLWVPSHVDTIVRFVYFVVFFVFFFFLSFFCMWDFCVFGGLFLIVLCCLVY